MQIAGIVLRPEGAPDGPVLLAPGRTVAVEVLQINGGRAMVKIAGRVFQAAGDLPAAADIFQAVVEETGPDVIKLRRTDGPPEQTPTPETLARQLGLPPGPDGSKLVGELLKWQLPLDRRLVLLLLAGGKDLTPEERTAYWPVRAWLETLDIHTDPSGLRTALDYLLGNDRATPQGQEVLNQARPLFPGQEMVSFFTFRGAGMHGELYIIDERGGKKQAPDFPAGLVLRVQSRVLGETWVHLLQNDGVLTARVSVAGERLVHPVREAARALRAKLAALGYRVGEIRVDCRPVRSICELLRPDAEPSYRPLNATV